MPMKPVRKRWLTPAQHRRMSYNSKRRQGQNGKWETNKRKADARAVVRQTAKIDPLIAKGQHVSGATEEKQLRQARKFTKKLQGMAGSPQLALLLPKLKRLKISPVVLCSTDIGEALADVTKRLKLTPLVSKVATALLEKWSLVAADGPPASMDSQNKVPPHSGSADSSATQFVAEECRRVVRQSKLEVTRTKARSEEDMQVKHTAQLLAFLEHEETQAQSTPKRSVQKRKRFEVDIVRSALKRQKGEQEGRAVRQRREEEARAKAVGVDAEGGLVFSQPAHRASMKSCPSQAASPAMASAAVGADGPSTSSLAAAPPKGALPTMTSFAPITSQPQKQQKLTGFFRTTN